MKLHSFSHFPVCHLPSLPCRHPHALSLPLYSERSRVNMKEILWVNKWCFFPWWLSLSDLNDDDYYMKKHWLISCTTAYLCHLTGTRFLTALNLLFFSEAAQKNWRDDTHCECKLTVIKLLALQSNKHNKSTTVYINYKCSQHKWLTVNSDFRWAFWQI